MRPRDRAARQDAEREGLNTGDRFVAADRIAEGARKLRNLGDPATVVFTFEPDFAYVDMVCTSSPYRAIRPAGKLGTP